MKKRLANGLFFWALAGALGLWGDPISATASCVVEEDFESGAPGWVLSPLSTCSTGSFVIGTPTQQVGGGVTTQPGGSFSGDSSAFTAINSSPGIDDVDAGNCILESPIWLAAEDSVLTVAYWHGQRDAGDDPTGDSFRLEISTDGGQGWNPLASNGDSTSNAVWREAGAFVSAGSQVQLRVQCADGAGPGDLVECGIDKVQLCQAPINNKICGTVDGCFSSGFCEGLKVGSACRIVNGRTCNIVDNKCNDFFCCCGCS